MTDQPTPDVAVVREALPNFMFRVELPGGRRLLAHVAGDARARMTRLKPGDEVRVEVSPYDTGVCRIVGRAPGTRGR